VGDTVTLTSSIAETADESVTLVPTLVTQNDNSQGQSDNQGEDQDN
jgi:hypothetical protein